MIVKPAHLPNGWTESSKRDRSWTQMTRDGFIASPIKKKNSKQNLKIRRESYVKPVRK